MHLTALKCLFKNSYINQEIIIVFYILFIFCKKIYYSYYYKYFNNNDNINVYFERYLCLYSKIFGKINWIKKIAFKYFGHLNFYHKKLKNI